MLLLKNLLFTVVVPGTGAVLVPLYLARSRFPPPPGVTFALGLALLGIGGVAYLWCVWDFATFGRGTPAPIDAPKKLVIRGLYRYTRNPMYVAVLTVVLGWGVLLQSPILFLYALLAGAAFHLFVVLYEEPTLSRQFGDEYEGYRTRVNRWLPRPPR